MLCKLNKGKVKWKMKKVERRRENKLRKVK